MVKLRIKKSNDLQFDMEGVVYYIILYYTILYYTILYYTILYYIKKLSWYPASLGKLAVWTRWLYLYKQRKLWWQSGHVGF